MENLENDVTDGGSGALAGAVLCGSAGCSMHPGGGRCRVPAFGAGPIPAIDVDQVLLDQSRMQAITGGGEHLTIIPSMDAKSPVDVDILAQTAPPQCRFVYADTATFGPDIEGFHKTTFQNPLGAG